MTRMALSIGLFALVGCGSSSEEQACTGTVESAIVGGSTSAELLAAGAEQMRAVVELELDAPPGAVCSGVVIADDWVLSARHCAEAAPILGVRLEAAGGLARALEVHPHPELDLLLVKLEPGSLPVEPISAGREPLGPGWIGAPAQIAGHGVGSPDGAPAFLAVSIDAVSAREISVNAGGIGGACLGDSGGPLLVRGADGAVRVAGVLRAGSATCRGLDHYTRVDAAAPFLDALIGLPEAPAPTCGSLETAGRCYGERAVWCENGAVRAADCAAPLACGWDAAAGGFRCVDRAGDPCSGIDDLGHCEGDVAVRCAGGTLEHTSCASCGASCSRAPSSGRVACGF